MTLETLWTPVAVEVIWTPVDDTLHMEGYSMYPASLEIDQMFPASLVTFCYYICVCYVTLVGLVLVL